MNTEEADNDFSQWFSTYGLITAERILGTYQLKPAQKDLVAAIKNPGSFFHHLLQVPLKNVLNGIVLQQSNDYHVYAQKLFIDYLLSGESAKDEESHGASTREAIESERQQLVLLGDEFHKVQGKHDYCIASSQSYFMKKTKELNEQSGIAISALNNLLKPYGFTGKKNQIRQAIDYSLIHSNLTEPVSEADKSRFVDHVTESLQIALSEEQKEKITDVLSNLFQIISELYEQSAVFMENTREISQLANSYRNQFYTTIVRVIELIKLLPEYKIDPIQDGINREPLYFDNRIGASDK